MLPTRQDGFLNFDEVYSSAMWNCDKVYFIMSETVSVRSNTGYVR